MTDRIFLLTIMLLSFFVFHVMVYALPLGRNRVIEFFLRLVFSMIGLSVVWFFKHKIGAISNKEILITWILSFLVLGLLLLKDIYRSIREDSPIKEKNKTTYHIILKHNRGKIVYNNPYNGFLIYGGAESGKTLSVGKPLLREYMRNGFTGFLYDAKENDYTKTALKIKEEINYPYPIYNIDFINPSVSYRVNPISPSIIKIPELVPEFSKNFFLAQMGSDEKVDEWVNFAMAAFKGVFWRFFEEFPQFCTLPHVTNFCVNTSREKLIEFLKGNKTSRIYAGALINSLESDKTYASIMTTLNRYLGDFSANKNVLYVLSGNDFDLNPINPQSPKMITVSNHFIARNTISPVVATMLTTIIRQIRFDNKIPCVFFLDEATTFKIPELESYPSELREYLISFVLITQSAAKIEKVYGKFDRSSIESNLSNQFFGWTGDIMAIDNYAKQFSKIVEKTRSRTRSGFKESQTTGERKDVRYDGSFFSSLRAGEFVGKAKNANVKTFHTRFKPYPYGKAKELPQVRNLKESTINDQYQKILNDINDIIF